MLGEPSLPAPVGVGSNDPHSVPLVRRTDVMSSDHTPRRIKPQVGKPAEDDVQSSSAEPRGVLGKDERRANLANDAEHLEPESRAVSGETSAASRAGDVLAGEASRNNVNCSAPRRAVERADVVPDGEWIEVSVSLALSEHALTVGVDLDGADGAPTEKAARKQSSAGAGK
jgi:hypothetical protein